MNSFPDVLKEWQFFYSTVAAASATLTGLLFVAVSINAEKLTTSQNANRMRSARGAFGDFLYVIMIGVIFLVPHPVPFGFSFALTILGLARAVGTYRLMRGLRRQTKDRPNRTQLLREFTLPIFTSIGLVIIAMLVYLGNFTAIYAMVMVIAALLIMASWHAWDLLFLEKDS